MRIVCLADIHIGSQKDTTYMFNVLTDILDRELVHKKSDAIIICGDLFDSLFKANSDYVSLAINFVSYMITMCKKSKTKIRFVYGTESHEMSQYRLFNHHFSDPTIDIKLINTVTSEELFPNTQVLYIPEEYMTDKHEHYLDHLYGEMKYKYIFGHGIIAEGMPMAAISNSNKNGEKKVPVFKSGELSKVSDICLFGHYHCYTDMGDNCYYIGSLFRDRFGEELPKGYIVISGDEAAFIENTAAHQYTSYEFEEGSPIFADIDNLIREIGSIKKAHADIISGEKTGKIRLIFRFPDDVDQAFRDTVRTLLLEDKVFSILMKDSTNKREQTDQISNIEDIYVLDPSLTMVDKLHKFITKKYDHIPITQDEIKAFIYEELKI